MLVLGAVVLARHALGALDVAGGEAGWGRLARLFAVFFGVAGAAGRVRCALAILAADVADEALGCGEKVVAVPAELVLVLALRAESAIVEHGGGRGAPPAEGGVQAGLAVLLRGTTGVGSGEGGRDDRGIE